ncbi:hypothetical protein HanIR_Chr14g0697861 [Helianthus annuus]|nr:hypothetical protein HanIR_Chr14g0697861 [Helianthus annuus]
MVNAKMLKIASIKYKIHRLCFNPVDSRLLLLFPHGSHLSLIHSQTLDFNLKQVSKTYISLGIHCQVKSLLLL